MSSSETQLLGRRQVIALLGAAPLAACGFTPVYGPGGTGSAVQGRVAIAAPGNRLSFALVSRLEERIGRADGGAYLLDYTIRTSQAALAVSGSDSIRRIRLRGTVSFYVTDVATNETVQSGQVWTFVAYASSGTNLQTFAARENAEQRLMIALADQIVARLLAGADTWA